MPRSGKRILHNRVQAHKRTQLELVSGSTGSRPFTDGSFELWTKTTGNGWDNWKVD